jgi:hypothetical protein
METARFFLGSCVIGAGLVVATAPGCSSNPGPPTQAAIQSHVEPAAGASAAKCQLSSSDWVDVGRIGSTQPNGQNPTLISTGNGNTSDDPSFNGGSVNLSCGVSSSGSGFNVSASASLGGTSGAGSLSISGTFNATGQQTGICATFSRGDSGQFQTPSGTSGCTCTVDFKRPDGTGGESKPGAGDGMGIASGKVWGYLNCPLLENRAQTLTGGSYEQCAFVAEFRFENCSK